jgi:hypothetical protein
MKFMAPKDEGKAFVPDMTRGGGAFFEGMGPMGRIGHMSPIAGPGVVAVLAREEGISGLFGAIYPPAAPRKDFSLTG